MKTTGHFSASTRMELMKGSNNGAKQIQVVLALEAAHMEEEEQASNDLSAYKEESQERIRTHEKDSQVIKKMNFAVEKNHSMTMRRALQQQQNYSTEEENDSALSFKEEDPWKIKKVLTREVDLSNRLLLGKGLISTSILPCLDQNSAKICKSRIGILLNIWDADTKSEHQLVLKKWYTHYFALTGNWKRDFVERRNLKMKDEIRFGLDSVNSRFCFRVVRQSQN